MGKTGSEYLVEAICTAKAVLDERATRLVDLAREISAAGGEKVGAKI
jgi:hypothetical protein